MYPLTRLLLVSLKALRASPLEPDGIAETSFRCRPWDLDMFMEMNNGRVLTLYDLGRFDLSIRTGLAKLLKKTDGDWPLPAPASDTASAFTSSTRSPCAPRLWVLTTDGYSLPSPCG